MVKKVGCGNNTLFWLDRWIDNRRLCDRFPRVQWRWALKEDGKFAVKDLARLVDDIWLQTERSGHETMWNNLVPKKVNVFVWCVLKGRLLVRNELDKRGIDLDTLLCPCCDDNVETFNHSLLLCNTAWSVWVKKFQWWDGGNVDVFTIGEIFKHNGFNSQSMENKKWWQVVGGNWVFHLERT
ncbi:RNA-directed DNA polymerase, eukaryota, reverse transcriptase zinc-binding domain protein [Tanacetum coccineum]